MSNAQAAAKALGAGAEQPNGDGYVTLCPCHEDTHPSLSIKDGLDGDVIVHCHVGCDPLAIKDELRRRGLLPEWKPEQAKSVNNTLSPPSSLCKFSGKSDDNEKEAPSYPWKQAKRDEVSIRKYLESRAIYLDEIPKPLKWGTYKDQKTGQQVNQIVCAASKPGDDKVYAVQRLFIDTDSWTKTDQRMLGPVKGRGVWFDRKGDIESLAVGEGIETCLSFIATTGAIINTIAALSASNMLTLELPEETRSLYLLVDSDPASKGMAGQHAAYALAQKFEASHPERKAYLVPPDDSCFTGNPTKLDFNDLLQTDPNGDSICDRLEKVIPFEKLGWKPKERLKNPENQGNSNQNPIDIFKRYAVTDEYVNSIGQEKFLYPNLIIKNHILVIVAESGAGKTTLLFFYVAAEIAKQGYTVLYFDADSPPSDHPRMKKHADEHGFQHLIPDLNQGTSLGTLMADLQKMAESQVDLSKYVMFFDTLKKFTNLMSKEGAKDFFVLMRKLTKLGATVVLPGHANKHRDGDGNLVFEGVGDVKSDCDDMIIFERNKKPDGSLDVTTICDSDHGAKVRGLFKTFSFNISPEREITFYDKPLEMVDLSHTGSPKATDSEILDVAEQYLKDREEPVTQQELVDYACDAVEGTAGKERVRKLIVQKALLKSSFTTKEDLPFGIRFVFSAGERNKRLYELPPEPPKQQPIFGEAV